MLATDDEAVIGVPALRLVARHRLPAQRRPARIWGDEQTTGKETSDIARRKKTLPLIYAFEDAGPTASGSRDPTRTADPPRRSVTRSRAILERVGARAYTRARAARHRDEALAELDAMGIIEREPRERARGDHREG